MRRCRRCHGMHGTGDGSYASSMDPRPADLTAGQYAHLEPGFDDAALARLLTDGIEGTAMGPQPIGEAERDPIIQYVRWLATQ